VQHMHTYACEWVQFVLYGSIYRQVIIVMGVLLWLCVRVSEE
jgi:hypothetical protein